MKYKIDRVQYFCLIPNLVFAKAIGFTSGITARKIGADVWSSMLVGFAIGTVMLIVMIFTASRFPEKTIVEYSKDLLGNIPSKLIGTVLSLFFAIAYISSADTVTIHIKHYMLTETPFIAMCIIYSLLCVYGVKLGAEVIIRFSFFALVMIVILNTGMIFGTLAAFDIRNLLPVFDKGIISNVTSSVYVFSDIAIAILSIGMIYPMLNTKKKSISLTFWAMLASTVLVITWPFTEVSVMGADVMKQFAVVCMQQARNAQLSIYLPRYELIMISLFIWSAFVQSTILFYCSFYSFKQAFNINKDNYILIPLTITLITATYYLGFDHNDFTHFLEYPLPQVSAILSIGLPLLFLIVYFLRKNKIKLKST